MNSFMPAMQKVLFTYFYFYRWPGSSLLCRLSVVVAAGSASFCSVAERGLSLQCLLFADTGLGSRAPVVAACGLSGWLVSSRILTQ